MSHESAPDTPLHYVLDATDRIVRVNPHWDRFAQHNQAEHLLGALVGWAAAPVGPAIPTR